MANAKSRALGPSLSRVEQIAGFLYLPFYVYLLTFLMQMTLRLMDVTVTLLQFNGAWFVLNTLFVWIIFRNFLVRSFRSIRFWETVQAVILGFVLYYAGSWVFDKAVELLKVQIVSFNDQSIRGLISENYWVMLISCVVLAPMAEETLARGLIFGVIRRKSRIAAYLASILFFSLIHVWQDIPQYGITPVLLAALQYIPASIALGWTYEKANTVWAPIFLHMIINGISMSLI